MNVLFIHQNFPGQFIHLAAKLAREKHNKVVALSIHKNPVPDGVIHRPYSLLHPANPKQHALLQDHEAKVLRAEACAAAAMQLKQEGFLPDVIVAHCGWGESLFMKDIFPSARLIVYGEFYYSATGQDVGFDPELPALTVQQQCQLRLRNANNLLSLDAADAAISPTQWQKSTYPAYLQHKIEVIHDGIEAQRLQPNPNAHLRLAANGHHPEYVFRPGDEVMSYVARNLEATRGFHVMMRVLPEILQARPKAHVMIVGGNDLSYGGKAPGNLGWKEYMLREVGQRLDLGRVHFVGKIPYPLYLNLLNVSKVHAYWSTPFVLSWSLLEAAVHGMPVVASATPPVQEFATQLGLDTVDFFDQAGFAKALIAYLARDAEPRQGRAVPPEIDLTTCLTRQMALLTGL